MDTTLRDGEQTPGVSFTPEEKLHLARTLLTRAKIDRLEIGSARVSAGEHYTAAQNSGGTLQRGRARRKICVGTRSERKCISGRLDRRHAGRLRLCLQHDSGAKGFRYQALYAA